MASVNGIIPLGVYDLPCPASSSSLGWESPEELKLSADRQLKEVLAYAVKYQEYAITPQ